MFLFFINSNVFTKPFLRSDAVSIAALKKQTLADLITNPSKLLDEKKVCLERNHNHEGPFNTHKTLKKHIQNPNRHYFWCSHTRCGKKCASFTALAYHERVCKK